MNSHDKQPIETLHLNDRDKAKLLHAIEESSHQPVASERRRLRMPWFQQEVTLTLFGETGNSVRATAMARNLSRWGIALIYGRYVYPRTRCEVQIPGLDGVWHGRSGRVLHVRHVSGLVHELGVTFDIPLDLSNFATLSPDEETRHLQEMADDMPADDPDTISELASRVLVIDDYASDRKLFGHWLSRVGMQVSTVADGTSARERIEQTQFDIVVVDYRLASENGAELIRTLRNSQFVAPILAVSADDSEETRDRTLAAGADRFLSKPFTAKALVQTMRELMGFDDQRQTDPIFSQYNDDTEMRPLLTEFTRGLAVNMEKLREANARHDYETLEQIAHALKGAGSGYGFSQISGQAEQLLFTLNDTAADMQKIKFAANELLCILNRVKLR